MMKTKLIAICLIALAGAAFAGCTKNPDVTPDTPDTTEEEQTETVPDGIIEEPVTDTDMHPEDEIPEEDETPKSAEELYAPLLSSFRDQLSGDAEATELTAFAEAIMSAEDGDASSFVGYRIEDVNDDGVKELLIGEVDAGGTIEQSAQGNALYAMYTLVENEPTIVLEGWARNRYTRMAQKNMFFHEGSGGAAYGIYAVYTFEPGADALTCRDFWFTAPKDDEQTEIGYYHNTVGDILPSESEELDVSPDDFWSSSSRLGEETVHIGFLPFSQYGNDVLIGTADMLIDGYSADDVYKTGEDGEAYTAVAFTSPRGVTDFTVYALTVTDIDEDGHLVCDKEAIAVCGDLFEEHPLIMDMQFMGDLPEYGVSYTDAEGTPKEYTVNVSGRDGTLSLGEY